MALAVPAAVSAGPSGLPALDLDPYSPLNFAPSYFPTGDEDDGRFLQVAGNNLETLANEKIVAYLGVPRTRTSFCAAVFDGDVGGSWDILSGSVDVLVYTLYADAGRDGSGTRVVETWTSATMIDDGWAESCRPVDADAQAASKHYFYRLEIGWQSPSVADDLNAFKLRSDGEVAIAIQKIGFIAAPNNLGVDPAVGAGDPDPATNDPSANSYDGSWSFHVHLATPAPSATFRDGDADRGDDSDDADTSNIDPDGTGPARAEGVNPGQPADDTSPYPSARVPGSVSYSVTGPDTSVWANDNPSGNREWEKFTITRPDGSDLPGGFYELRVAGMDAHNAMFIEPPGDIYAEPRAPLPVVNTPPVADAGPDANGDRLNDVAFDGSGSSDPDGTITSYAWDFGDGNGAITATAVHRYASLGGFTATLTVTDDAGASSTDSRSILVANLAPTASAGPDVLGTKLDLIHFDGAASSDSDGSVSSWSWDFGDGSGATGAVADHAFGSIAQFVVTLLVTDNDGASASDRLVVDIVNLPPVADAGADRGLLSGQTTVFYGFASYDPDGQIVAYAWDFGDGATATGDIAAHAWARPGVFTLTLTVTDDFGAQNTDSATVTVGNRAPVADAGPDISGAEGAPLAFDGSRSSDPDGTIVAYDWEFGDGFTGSGVTASHAYSVYGAYTVRLTVRDDSGVSASDSLMVSVGPASPGAVSVSMSKTGPDQVPTLTRVAWTLRGEVLNSGGTSLDQVVMGDRISSSLYEVLAVRVSQGTAAYTTNNGEITVQWSVGTLARGAAATIDIDIATRRTIFGTQQFARPGIYDLEMGATVSAVDGYTGGSLSSSSGAPPSVVASGAAAPEEIGPGASVADGGDLTAGPALVGPLLTMLAGLAAGGLGLGPGLGRTKLD